MSCLVKLTESGHCCDKISALCMYHRDTRLPLFLLTIFARIALVSSTRCTSSPLLLRLPAIFKSPLRPSLAMVPSRGIGRSTCTTGWPTGSTQWATTTRSPPVKFRQCSPCVFVYHLIYGILGSSFTLGTTPEYIVVRSPDSMKTPPPSVCFFGGLFVCTPTNPTVSACYGDAPPCPSAPKGAWYESENHAAKIHFYSFSFVLSHRVVHGGRIHHAHAARHWHDLWCQIPINTCVAAH